MQVENDKRRRWKVSGIHSFLYTLYRYHTPSFRSILDEEIWGFDHTSLLKMFNHTANWLDENQCHRLRQLDLVCGRFPHFNERIKSKLRSQLPDDIALPPDIDDAALFGDATRLAICKIFGDD